jgi:hypothetical protein
VERGGNVDSTVVDEYKKQLPCLCEGYSPKDIFNMDETGLFFRDNGMNVLPPQSVGAPIIVHKRN